MGEGNSMKAVTMLKVSLIFALIIDTLIAIVIVLSKDSIAHLFTGNPDVIMHLDLTFDTMAVLNIV